MKILNKSICIIVMVCFLSTVIIPSQALAQGVLGLPAPGTMVSLSPVFTPAILRGIRVYPDDALKFDFIVDSGDSGLKGDELKSESEKLIRYFLASLTLPENDLWVNLSPYEKDRIVPAELGSTEMGIDMLAQDYLLKQITASLTNPDSDLGKEFWAKIYKQSYEKFGTTNVPVDTFNKVWIMPEKAEVYVKEDRAFVVESRLKVMLETDYLALEKGKENRRENGEDRKENLEKTNLNNIKDSSSPLTSLTSNLHPLASDISSSIVREIIIPALEKEVNEGKNFARLRQIYNSIILSYWYKTNLKNSILNKVYADKKKIKGLEANSEASSVNRKTSNASQDTLHVSQVDQVYSQYLQTFKQGVCNMMKVEYDPYTKKNIPRKYFAGGVRWVLDATFNPVGKEIAYQYIKKNSKKGKKEEIYDFQVLLNDPNITLAESVAQEWTSDSTSTIESSNIKTDLALDAHAADSTNKPSYVKMNMTGIEFGFFRDNVKPVSLLRTRGEAKEHSLKASIYNCLCVVFPQKRVMFHFTQVSYLGISKEAYLSDMFQGLQGEQAVIVSQYEDKTGKDIIAADIQKIIPHSVVVPDAGGDFRHVLLSPQGEVLIVDEKDDEASLSLKDRLKRIQTYGDLWRKGELGKSVDDPSSTTKGDQSSYSSVFGRAQEVEKQDKVSGKLNSKEGTSSAIIKIDRFQKKLEEVSKRQRDRARTREEKKIPIPLGGNKGVIFLTEEEATRILGLLTKINQEDGLADVLSILSYSGTNPHTRSSRLLQNFVFGNLRQWSEARLQPALQGDAFLLSNNMLLPVALPVVKLDNSVLDGFIKQIRERLQIQIPDLTLGLSGNQERIRLPIVERLTDFNSVDVAFALRRQAPIRSQNLRDLFELRSVDIGNGYKINVRKVTEKDFDKNQKTFGLELEFQIADQDSQLERGKKNLPEIWEPIWTRIMKALPHLMGDDWVKDFSRNFANFQEIKTKDGGLANTPEIWEKIRNMLNEAQKEGGPLQGGISSRHVHYGYKNAPRRPDGRLVANKPQFERFGKFFEALFRGLGGRKWDPPTDGYNSALEDVNEEEKRIGDGSDDHSKIMNLSSHGTIEVKFFEGEKKTKIGEGKTIDTEKLEQSVQWGFNFLDMITQAFDRAPLAVLGIPALAGHKPTQKQIDRFIELLFEGDEKGAQYARSVFDELADEPAGKKEEECRKDDEKFKGYFEMFGLKTVYDRHDLKDGYDENLVEHFLMKDKGENIPAKENFRILNLARDLVRAGAADENSQDLALGYFPQEMHSKLREAILLVLPEISPDKRSKPKPDEKDGEEAAVFDDLFSQARLENLSPEIQDFRIYGVNDANEFEYVSVNPIREAPIQTKKAKRFSIRKTGLALLLLLGLFALKSDVREAEAVIASDVLDQIEKTLDLPKEWNGPILSRGAESSDVNAYRDILAQAFPDQNELVQMVKNIDGKKSPIDGVNYKLYDDAKEITERALEGGGKYDRDLETVTYAVQFHLGISQDGDVGKEIIHALIMHLAQKSAYQITPDDLETEKKESSQSSSTITIQDIRNLKTHLHSYDDLNDDDRKDLELRKTRYVFHKIYGICKIIEAREKSLLLEQVVPPEDARAGDPLFGQNLSNLIKIYKVASKLNRQRIFPYEGNILIPKEWNKYIDPQFEIIKRTPEEIADAMESLSKQDDLKYGLRSGPVFDFEQAMSDAFERILEGSKIGLQDRKEIAYNLSRMKTGSIETIRLCGIITNNQAEALKSRNSENLDSLSSKEKKDFVLRLEALIQDYDKNLTEKQKEVMLRRFVPLKIVDFWSNKYSAPRNTILFWILKRPNFPIFIPEGMKKAEQIKGQVAGVRNARRIVVSHGLDEGKGTDAWLENFRELRDRDGGALVKKVGDLSNFTEIAVAQGLSKFIKWTDDMEAKFKPEVFKAALEEFGASSTWQQLIKNGKLPKKSGMSAGQFFVQNNSTTALVDILRGTESSKTNKEKQRDLMLYTLGRPQDTFYEKGGKLIDKDMPDQIVDFILFHEEAFKNTKVIVLHKESMNEDGFEHIAYEINIVNGPEGFALTEKFFKNQARQIELGNVDGLIAMMGHEAGHNAFKFLSDEQKKKFSEAKGKNKAGAEIRYRQWEEKTGKKQTAASYDEESFSDWWFEYHFGNQEEIPSKVLEFMTDSFFPENKASSSSSAFKGGIDFNAENMNVTTKGDEIDLNIPLNMQNITSSNIEGFVPIIINITPVTDFMGLLGLGEKEKLEVGS